jgi:hypothetical protein
VSRAFRAAARAAAGALLAAGGVLPAAGGAAGADGGYRYWSFWVGEDDGAWTYATQGPGTLRAHDGDVLGFRFVVSGAQASTDQPREAADFAAVCGDAPAGGDARVALVVDFGTAGHAPAGETPPERRSVCAEVPDGATVAEALAASAGPLRYDSGGMLCAIAGYPARGCAEQVSSDDTASGSGDAGEAAAGPDDGDAGGSAVTVLAGAGAVALLGAAALLRARRRRRS